MHDRPGSAGPRLRQRPRSSWVRVRVLSARPTTSRPTWARPCTTCSRRTSTNQLRILRRCLRSTRRFAAIAIARGAAAKSAALRGLLERCDAVCAKSVVKILSGDLRIGLREGHLEAAIAAAFERPLTDVQTAGMLTGDLGHTAELARDDALGDAELVLFRPLKSMLASPVADEAEVLRRLGSPVWVEDKYDGIRAQLHKQGDEVRLFSRDLNDISDGYPEVVAIARRQPWDGILDGEVLAFRDGMALPFIQLQQRLGRKNPSKEMQEQVPVIYVAFDLLAYGPGSGARVEPTLTLPLQERRARLDAMRLPDVPGMATANLLNASSPQELSSIFDAAQERGNEGLMVKDPDSTYTPGRRGYGWLKLKRPLATLDCVVVAVEVGPRQAPRRPVRLHVRSPRRPSRRWRPTGHDRQGVQRSDRQGDRRDDGVLPRAHDRAARTLLCRPAHRRCRDSV